MYSGYHVESETVSGFQDFGIVITVLYPAVSRSNGHLHPFGGKEAQGDRLPGLVGEKANSGHLLSKSYISALGCPKKLPLLGKTFPVLG